MTTQRPIPSGDIPENFILTDEQKQQKYPSGILPSGQANFADQNQYPQINEIYPSPSSTINNLLATYPPSGYSPETRYLLGELKETGILHYDQLIQNRNFSNGFATQVAIELAGISDFNIFNPYIHYYPNINPSEINQQNKNSNYKVDIPYVSDYEIAEPFTPY